MTSQHAYHLNIAEQLYTLANDNLFLVLHHYLARLLYCKSYQGKAQKSFLFEPGLLVSFNQGLHAFELDSKLVQKDILLGYAFGNVSNSLLHAGLAFPLVGQSHTSLLFYYQINSYEDIEGVVDTSLNVGLAGLTVAEYLEDMLGDSPEFDLTLCLYESQNNLAQTTQSLSLIYLQSFCVRTSGCWQAPSLNRTTIFFGSESKIFCGERRGRADRSPCRALRKCCAGVFRAVCEESERECKQSQIDSTTDSHPCQLNEISQEISYHSLQYFMEELSMKIALFGSEIDFAKHLINQIYSRFDDFALQLVRQNAPASKHIFTFQFTPTGYDDPEAFTGFIITTDLSKQSSYEFTEGILLRNQFISELKVNEMFVVMVGYNHQYSKSMLVKFNSLVRQYKLNSCLVSKNNYEPIVDAVKSAVRNIILQFYKKNPAGNVSILQQDQSSDVHDPQEVRSKDIDIKHKNQVRSQISYSSKEHIKKHQETKTLNRESPKRKVFQKKQIPQTKPADKKSSISNQKILKNIAMLTEKDRVNEQKSKKSSKKGGKSKQEQQKLIKQKFIDEYLQVKNKRSSPEKIQQSPKTPIQSLYFSPNDKFAQQISIVRQQVSTQSMIIRDGQLHHQEDKTLLQLMKTQLQTGQAQLQEKQRRVRAGSEQSSLSQERRQQPRRGQRRESLRELLKLKGSKKPQREQAQIQDLQIKEQVQKYQEQVFQSELPRTLNQDLHFQTLVSQEKLQDLSFHQQRSSLLEVSRDKSDKSRKSSRKVQKGPQQSRLNQKGISDLLQQFIAMNKFQSIKKQAQEPTKVRPNEKTLGKEVQSMSKAVYGYVQRSPEIRQPQNTPAAKPNLAPQNFSFQNLPPISFSKQVDNQLNSDQLKEEKQQNNVKKYSATQRQKIAQHIIFNSLLQKDRQSNEPPRIRRKSQDRPLEPDAALQQVRRANQRQQQMIRDKIRAEQIKRDQAIRLRQLREQQQQQQRQRLRAQEQRQRKKSKSRQRQKRQKRQGSKTDREYSSIIKSNKNEHLSQILVQGLESVDQDIQSLQQYIHKLDQNITLKKSNLSSSGLFSDSKQRRVKIKAEMVLVDQEHKDQRPKPQKVIMPKTIMKEEILTFKFQFKGKSAEIPVAYNQNLVSLSRKALKTLGLRLSNKNEAVLQRIIQNQLQKLDKQLKDSLQRLYLHRSKQK